MLFHALFSEGAAACRQRRSTPKSTTPNTCSTVGSPRTPRMPRMLWPARPELPSLLHCRAPGPPRTAAAGASHQRPRGTPPCQRPARHQLPLASAPAADHAATLWQWCCPIGRAAADLHLVGDSHARSVPAARHGLEIGHKLASGAASGRIGRCPPGQPCAAWPSSRARRTQKAEKIAAPRGVRARAGEGRCPRAVRRSRDDPVRCTAASDAQR